MKKQFNTVDRATLVALIAKAFRKVCDKNAN